MMKEVVITSAVRTAIGNFLGALSPFSATELGGKVIEEAVRRSSTQKKDIDEVIMRNGLPLSGRHGGRQPHCGTCLKITAKCKVSSAKLSMK